jgi:hypothetical protein
VSNPRASARRAWVRQAAREVAGPTETPKRNGRGPGVGAPSLVGSPSTDGLYRVPDGLGARIR